MPKIIECVPNFSEGRNEEVIEAIKEAIAQSPGCSLLGVEPGESTNRTIYTFVGSPEAVVEGALNAARAAYHLIDMQKHKGEHPRMGAMDVCPFIPVQDVTMEECIACAKELGRRMADELEVPVYLYDEACDTAYRKTLPQIRSGEYEGLPKKLNDRRWRPDFGRSQFNPSWGATAVGARKFLIEFNIILVSTKEQAHEIALNIMGNGSGQNECVRLKGMRAMGRDLQEAHLAQVSVDITDSSACGIHRVYEVCCEYAAEKNVAVIGSHIVGLVPAKAILETAEYYMKKENLFILEEDPKLRLVINRLGLNSLGAFIPKERIIEYMIQPEKEGALTSMDLKDFILTVGSRSPSPAGGSVAALASSLGAALGSMVGFLTYGNKEFADLDSHMRKLIPPLYNGMKELSVYVDAAAAAFNDYVMATKLPKSTEEETRKREEAMKKGMINAVQVLMKVAEIVNEMWPHMKELARFGNIKYKSDLQVGTHILETGVWGAYYNVMTYLDQIEDEDLKSQMQRNIKSALVMAQKEKEDILKILEKR